MRIVVAACILSTLGDLNDAVCGELLERWEQLILTPAGQNIKTLDEVLDWIQAFNSREFHTEVEQLKEAAKLTKPGTAALDIGSGCGYSALRLLKELPTGPSLVLVDNNNNDIIVQKMLSHLGLNSTREVIMLYGKHSNQLFYQESVQSDTFRSKGPYGFVFIDSHELNYRADLEGLEKLDLLVDGAIIVLSGVKESQTYDGHVQYFTDDHPQFTLVNDRNAPATIYKYSTSGRATPTPGRLRG
jgi:predicted O-methyltransferase YrrM